MLNVKSDAISRHASSDKLEIPIDSPINLIDSFVVTKRLLECVVVEEDVAVVDEDVLLLVAEEGPFVDWPLSFDPEESFIVTIKFLFIYLFLKKLVDIC